MRNCTVSRPSLYPAPNGSRVIAGAAVWTSETGEESVACSRSDGLGLRRLDEVGIAYVIVSTETNPVVSSERRGRTVTSAVSVTAPLSGSLMPDGMTRS